MVALVAGLVVSGAAVALVVALIKSNSETIRATRLTQELRTTAEVMSRDLRRARSVTDPIANVGAATPLGACNAITPASTDTPPNGSCVKYAYDCKKDSAGVVTGQFNAIGLVGGKVRMVSLGTGMPACPAATDGTQLSSDLVTVTGLTITALNADGYTIRVAGRFTNDASATPLTRWITQEVRVRSAAIN
ncbi:MAG: hypothetical protein HOQ02_08075 [Lysobacter sp.]|nr:hypothetical protein [Lysobacter sp.]